VTVGASDDLRATVARIAHLPVERVSDASRLSEDLGIRSLDRLELAVSLETRLGVKLSDASVMKARTVADLRAACGV
jgi:acyl carrier protein